MFLARPPNGFLTEFEGPTRLDGQPQLNLAGIDSATFQIMTPVPEPEMSVLMLAGTGGVVSVMHRRRRESRAWISDERDA